MEVVQEADITWMWLTWAITVVLFFVCLKYVEALKNRIYPKIVTQRHERRVFDLLIFPVLAVVFLFLWGLALGFFYS